ncbi:hypothetical protein JNK13_08120 [bacterium]|nr:hypothetical protein [bacterium]
MMRTRIISALALLVVASSLSASPFNSDPASTGTYRPVVVHDGNALFVTLHRNTHREAKTAWYQAWHRWLTYEGRENSRPNKRICRVEG